MNNPEKFMIQCTTRLKRDNFQPCWLCISRLFRPLIWHLVPA